jgi:mono/diheme cytochrome c family protein
MLWMKTAIARRLTALALTAGAAGWIAWGQPDAAVIGAADVPLDGFSAGELLLSELNCLACHRPAFAVKERLAPKSAPSLAQLEARVSPRYLLAYLDNPLAAKPGLTMPDVLHSLVGQEKNDTVEALVHFLVSEEAFPAGRPLRPEPETIAAGRLLYHQVGCTACHPPQEPAADLFANVAGGSPTDPEVVRFVLRKLEQTSVPLGELANKYTLRGLAGYLVEPLSVQPSGRMPSLNLTEAESQAIAAYLLRNQPRGRSRFVVVEDKVARGEELFAALGCAACHQPGLRPPTGAARRIPRLARLQANRATGCLAELPGKAAPKYHLNPAQRQALREVLGAADKLKRPLSNRQQVARTLAQLNCYSCHSRDGVGGPTPSRADYFTVLGDADLGDEGRLPGHLTDLGNKLRADWLREVLIKKGIVRPYMAVRMPQYGQANVKRLVKGFGQADPRWPSLRAVSSSRADHLEGQKLVGTGGYSCISCHRFDPHKSLGLSVTDMTVMTRRLKKDWFRRYLPDPPALRPGTRMPSFWPDGKAILRDVLEGDTDRQIEAIWSYLSKGTNAAPPRGLGTSGK